jgi:hypothetical protein
MYHSLREQQVDIDAALVLPRPIATLTSSFSVWKTSLIYSKHHQDLKFKQSIQNSKRKVFNERTKVENTTWCHDDGATKSEPAFLCNMEVTRIYCHARVTSLIKVMVLRTTIFIQKMYS